MIRVRAHVGGGGAHVCACVLCVHVCCVCTSWYCVLWVCVCGMDGHVWCMHGRVLTLASAGKQ